MSSGSASCESSSLVLRSRYTVCGLVATLRACETPLLFGVGTLRRSGSLHVDTLADSLVLRSRYALGGLVVDVCLQNSPAHLSRYTLCVVW